MGDVGNESQRGDQPDGAKPRQKSWTEKAFFWRKQHRQQRVTKLQNDIATQHGAIQGEINKLRADTSQSKAIQGEIDKIQADTSQSKAIQGEIRDLEIFGSSGKSIADIMEWIDTIGPQAQRLKAQRARDYQGAPPPRHFRSTDQTQRGWVRTLLGHRARKRTRSARDQAEGQLQADLAEATSKFQELQERLGHREETKTYINGIKAKCTRYNINRFDISRDVEDWINKIRDAGPSTEVEQLKDAGPSTNVEQLEIAETFYSKMIEPLIEKGSDVFASDQNYKKDLYKKLASAEGANIVLSYSLFKVQSSSRANSPDSLIDMAEVEMLRQYCVIARVAQTLGLTLHFTITNEADVFPSDDPLGLNDKDKAMNMAIANSTIKDFKADGLVTIRPLKASVASALGADFDRLYNTQKENCCQETRKQINENRGNLKSNAFAFLDSISDRNLSRLGITSPVQIRSIRAIKHNESIAQLPPALVDYLVDITATWRGLLNLREEAMKKVRADGKTNEYPEYSDNRVHAGLTLSPNRLSLKPSLKRVLGQTLNSTFGITVYQTQKYTRELGYAGLAKYPDFTDLQKAGEAIEIVSLDRKPIFAVWQNEPPPTGYPPEHTVVDDRFLHYGINHDCLAATIAQLDQEIGRKNTALSKGNLTESRSSDIINEITAIRAARSIIDTLRQRLPPSSPGLQKIWYELIEDSKNEKHTKLAIQSIRRYIANYAYKIFFDHINSKNLAESVEALQQERDKKYQARTQERDKLDRTADLSNQSAMMQNFRTKHNKDEATLLKETDELDAAIQMIVQLQNLFPLARDWWEHIVDKASEKARNGVVSPEQIVRVTIVNQVLKKGEGRKPTEGKEKGNSA